MLESLHVKNIALIDETEVSFSDGLNILTGETGAGKSLVIGSIALALGARADKQLIREGAEYALVELVFSVDEVTRQKLAGLDIIPEDGFVILSRKIMPGKSVCRICGETVSGNVLKEAAGLLLDLHAQHDNQILLKKQSHLEILDTYLGEKIETDLSSCKEAYHAYKGLLLKQKEILEISQNKDKELELAKYEYDEIMKANLSEGEDETLEKAYHRMKNARTIAENVTNVANILGGENNIQVMTMLDKALELTGQTLAMDESLSEIQNDLSSANELVAQSYRTLSRYLDGFEFSQEEYLQTEARLNEINRLKDKFGFNITDVLAYARNLEQKIEQLEDVHAYEEKLAIQVEKAYQVLESTASKLSKMREKAAKELEIQLKQALSEMNFLDVKLAIDIASDMKQISVSGCDDVCFMISLNPGEQLKPLTQVASGGELSRIMLALKAVLATSDQIPTLIFDEIDTGISGKTAWKVSEKLNVIAKSHQVICITHLPQIAAMADHHFLIEKSATKDVTTTHVNTLDEKASLEEIARLLGSDELTEAALQNAMQLKQQAMQTKE